VCSCLICQNNEALHVLIGPTDDDRGDDGDVVDMLYDRTRQLEGVLIYHVHRKSSDQIDETDRNFVSR